MLLLLLHVKIYSMTTSTKNKNNKTFARNSRHLYYFLTIPFTFMKKQLKLLNKTKPNIENNNHMITETMYFFFYI